MDIWMMIGTIIIVGSLWALSSWQFWHGGINRGYNNCLRDMRKKHRQNNPNASGRYIWKKNTDIRVIPPDDTKHAEAETVRVVGRHASRNTER